MDNDNPHSGLRGFLDRVTGNGLGTPAHRLDPEVRRALMHVLKAEVLAGGVDLDRLDSKDALLTELGPQAVRPGVDLDLVYDTTFAKVANELGEQTETSLT